MFDLITFKSCEGDEIACNGNTFQEETYFWCTEHNGEYSEYSADNLFLNSDLDGGYVPITMLKTGSTVIRLKEAEFTEM